MTTPPSIAGHQAAAPRPRLQGRRIVVTGAASGIGRAVSELFHQAAARLTLLDRNAAGLAETVSCAGGQPFDVNITDEAAVAKAVAAGASAMGGIDGIVNAAGIQLRGAAKDVEPASWRRVVEVNLTGAYVVVHHCPPWLLKEAGSIVNISSGQGLLLKAPNRTAYAASNGGLVNLSLALAAELAPRIRVNSVCPGAVNTPLLAAAPASLDAYALKRIAEPIEVAQAVMFLTSFEASYVTGAALAVDGGRSIH